MPVYRVDYMVCASAYIRADSEQAAEVIARKHNNTGIEVYGEDISDLRFDDPSLPEFSLSPVMTVDFFNPHTIEEME